MGQVLADESVSIRKILRENKAEEWTEVLEGHGVYSVRDLRTVKYADLVQFGISEFEPRKRIFEIIKQLNTQCPYGAERRASLHQRMQSLARSSIGFPSMQEEAPRSSYGVGAQSSTYSHIVESRVPMHKNTGSMRLSPIKMDEKQGRNSLGLYGREDKIQSTYEAGNLSSASAVDELSSSHSSQGLSPVHSYTERRSSLGMRKDLHRSTEHVFMERTEGSVLKEGYSPGGMWKRKKDMVDEIMREAEESIIIEEEEDLDMQEPAHMSMIDQETSAEYPSIISGDEQTGLISWEGSEKREDCKAAENSRIMVIVRKRPMKRDGKRDTVTISGSEVILTESKQKVDLTPYMEPHTYAFDRAYGERNTTEDIYRECVQRMVQYAMDGGSATCIAYGQTGSGKTYTMLNEQTGMIALALRDLLKSRIKLSFYEIYSNCIYDLLDERKKIFAREKDGVVSIIGVKELSVGSLQDAVALLKQGLQCRMTGKTGANSNSSRSHALVRVRTESGIFTFVDLAGSERGTERGLESQQSLIKREGAEINKSLLALKECIRAMDKSATHLPFRHSKLTQVLKESLIGESKCCIIATISPEEASTEHSLNTLRYAYRIRGLGLKGDNAPQPRAATPVKRTTTTSAPNTKSTQQPMTVLTGQYAAVPSTPVREKDRGKVRTPQRSPATQKVLVQQALATVASRIARERDPETLEILKEALLEIANYQRIS
ncbi:kinesin family member 2/24 [Nematocida ausubeli]|nr:kinesin family member 2/24 [Nematocida ausubeli]